MTDSFSDFDQILNEPDRVMANPWSVNASDGQQYLPDYALLEQLLAIPIAAGAPTESGRFANAVDAWIADELRRAGLGEHEVWPRRRAPRTMLPEVARIEQMLEEIEQDIIAKESRREPHEVMMPSLRSRFFALRKRLDGGVSAYVLGRFYRKQVDVVVVSVERGPELMVSSKTMSKDFRNNIPNRFEEAIGDGTNLKARFPIAPLGFALLVRSSVLEESGSYALLDNMVRGLQTSEGGYDAAMLLVAEWNDPPAGGATDGWDPAVRILRPDDPRVSPGDTGADVFFRKLLEKLFEVVPVQFHVDARTLWGYVPPGGVPDEDAGTVD